MNKKVAIVTSGHPPEDERIFHKTGFTLTKYGYKVTILCSTLKVDKTRNNITILGFEGDICRKKEKIEKLTDMLIQADPECIICCEPLTILAAHRFKRKAGHKVKIISDITEWYPENVAFKFKGIKRILSFLKLYLFNIYATNLADRLIIGETTKLRRYKWISPFKEKEIIGYYPRLEYFQYSPPPFNGKNLTLCYSGLINLERGVLTLLEVSERLADQFPWINIILKIVGKFEDPGEEIEFMKHAAHTKKIKLNLMPWGNYSDISVKIQDADICFDLRKPGFIYLHSLPIKIFEYMACGKPFIFSDIKPIRKEMAVNEYGFLVNPLNIDEIISRVKEYLNNNSLLIKHSKAARRQAELHFNWEKLEEKLIKFIES